MNHRFSGFQCPVDSCKELFNRPDTMRQHWEDVHRDMYCLICGYHNNTSAIHNHIEHNHRIRKDTYNQLFRDWHEKYFSSYAFNAPRDVPWNPPEPKIFVFQPPFKFDDIVSSLNLDSFRIVIGPENKLILNHDYLYRERPDRPPFRQ